MKKQQQGLEIKQPYNRAIRMYDVFISGTYVMESGVKRTWSRYGEYEGTRIGAMAFARNMLTPKNQPHVSILKMRVTSRDRRRAMMPPEDDRYKAIAIEAMRKYAYGFPSLTKAQAKSIALLSLEATISALRESANMDKDLIYTYEWARKYLSEM